MTSKSQSYLGQHHSVSSISQGNTFHGDFNYIDNSNYELSIEALDREWESMHLAIANETLKSLKSLTPPDSPSNAVKETKSQEQYEFGGFIYNRTTQSEDEEAASEHMEELPAHTRGHTRKASLEETQIIQAQQYDF